MRKEKHLGFLLHSQKHEAVVITNAAHWNAIGLFTRMLLSVERKPSQRIKWKSLATSQNLYKQETKHQSLSCKNRKTQMTMRKGVS